MTFPERLLSNKYLLGPTFCVGPYFFPPSLLPPSIEYVVSLFFFETRLGRRKGVRFFTWYVLVLNCVPPFLWAKEVSGGTEKGFG